MDIESSRLMGHGEPDAAAAWVTVEEWGGSSGSALSRTAVLTASASSLTSDRMRTLACITIKYGVEAGTSSARGSWT